MTIPSTPFRNDHIGDGTTGPYQYDWQILNAAHIRVVKAVIATGVETVLVLGVDFTVTGVGNEAGGNIYTIDPLPNTEKLTLLPSVPFEQDTDFTNQNSVKPSEAEAMADKLNRQIKQLAEQMNRTVKLPETATGPSDNYLNEMNQLLVQTQAARDTAVQAKDDAEDAEDGAVTAENGAVAARDAILNDAGFQAVAADLTGADNIGAVAGSIANVNTVAGGITNVNTVAGSITNVNNVGSNIAAVNSASANMAAIIAAPQAAIDAAAARDLAQNYAAALTGTSTTNLAIGLGSKVFTTQSGKQWALGQRLRAASDDGVKVMDGEVTAYSGTSLTINVDYTEDTGSHNDWNISISGSRGVAGAAGPSNYIAPTTTVGAQLNMLEATNNGTNKVVLQAPALLAADITVNLPAAAGDIALKSDIRGITVVNPVNASGSAVNITGIPSGAKRVVVKFYNVSTNGTSPYMLQLGTSGGVVLTGYTTGSIASVTGNSASGSTAAGISHAIVSSAANVYNGTVILDLHDAANNQWVATHLLNESARGCFSSGSVALSGVLDRIRVTTANGTDVFDAGTIGISYEF